MKILALCLVLAFGSRSPVDRAGPGLNILFFGNSYTAWNGGVDRVVQEVAVASGHAEPFVHRTAPGGYTLGNHLSSSTRVIHETLEPGEEWDCFVLQDQSYRPTHIGDLPGHRADAVALQTEMDAHSPAARAIMFMTWARAPGHSFYDSQTGHFADPAAMQGELRVGYRLSTSDIRAAMSLTEASLAPVGDAWELGAWDRLHAGDGSHPSARGTFLAGLVIYSTIYREPTGEVDLTAPAARLGLSADDAAELSLLSDESVFGVRGVGAGDAAQPVTKRRVRW